MGFLFNSSILDIIFILLSVVFYGYYFSVKTYKYWKKRNVKFVDPVPFFGNTLLTTFRKRAPPISHQEIYNSFPEERYVGMFMFRTPLLLVRDPKLVHSMLSKDFLSFYSRGITVDEKLDLLSAHLVNVSGQRWKTLRSKLTPVFSSGKLKSMSNQLEECANVLEHYLEESVEQGGSHEMREVMAKFATDVIGSCAFGLQFNSLKDPDSQFRKMGREVFKQSKRFIIKFIFRTIHPKLPYYLNIKALHPNVEQFFLDFVKDTIKHREENSIGRNDFIQLLVDLRKEDTKLGSLRPPTSETHDTSLIETADDKNQSFVLDDQVIASNAFVFFLAGFETTSSTMSFMLLELAANPNIQNTVRQEILHVLEMNNGILNYDIIKELPYMEKVIAETLRKYPIASALLRECTKDYQVPDSSFVIEKGTKILIPVFSLHRDPQYYPNPELFDPERFTPENKTNRLQGTYLPFGAGPRICIGLRFAMMEMMIGFCRILPRFEFRLSDKMVYPVEFKKGATLLAPEDGIWLSVHRRESNN